MVGWLHLDWLGFVQSILQNIELPVELRGIDFQLKYLDPLSNCIDIIVLIQLKKGINISGGPNISSKNGLGVHFLRRGDHSYRYRSIITIFMLVNNPKSNSAIVRGYGKTKYQMATEF